MLSATRADHGREEARGKARILFLCTGNSARSQIAEALTRQIFGDRIEPESAGTRPKGLDPRVVQVLEEEGIDLSAHRSKHVDSLAAQTFDLVVTVCDSARESCPRFAAAKKTIHYGFPDPPAEARAAATEEEALAVYRRVRDEIRAFVKTLPELVPSP